jgi:HEAT repeat protein
MTEPTSPPAVRDLPDDLPPVKPPSVGFIFQLFVVPALIVAAVVSAWVLFGKLASGEQDWESLLVQVSSPNAHIRYRAMNGLAQVLDADRRLGAASKQLSRNPRIAQALADEFDRKLSSTSTSDKTLSDQTFLARALGSVDQPQIALPPLLRALHPEYDVEVRKSAVTSVALIAGRELEHKSPLKGKDVSEGLIEFSTDPDPHLRRAAAFTLGLIDSPEARQRLNVLLEDTDWLTAVNAAVALSRQGSTEGYPVLKEILAGKVVVDPEAPQDASASELIIFRNAFKAVGGLADAFTPEQRTEMISLLTALAHGHRETRVRADAQTALSALRKTP